MSVTQVPASMTVEGVTAAQLAAKADSSTVSTLSSSVSTLQTQKLTQATAFATTSGTAADFTGIPSWVKRITIMFNGVSLSGTANLRIQLGTGGSPETSGYVSTGSYITAFGPGANAAASTSGFDTPTSAAASTFSGLLVFTNVSGNIWVANGILGNNAGGVVYTNFIAGGKSLAGTLNMVRITSANGTDTFDAGSVNILYE